MGKKKMVKMSLDEFQSSLGNQSTGEVDVSDLPTAPRAYVKNEVLYYHQVLYKIRDMKKKTRIPKGFSRNRKFRRCLLACESRWKISKMASIWLRIMAN
jgi:hypothetical protein